MEPSYYQPISLCTYIRFVPKLMVDKMKSILPCLICLEQGAFVGSRSITDNILVALEVMHDLQ